MKKDIYKKIAKDVINTEIISLGKLKSSLDINFKKAVEKILNCKKGKVILSGVGKSGIIAKKIASTLASVGTPSFFVDASSCSHGDLGQISSNDILILISNSGESIELKNIVSEDDGSYSYSYKLLGVLSNPNVDAKTIDGLKDNKYGWVR